MSQDPGSVSVLLLDDPVYVFFFLSPVELPNTQTKQKRQSGEKKDRDD